MFLAGGISSIPATQAATPTPKSQKPFSMLQWKYSYLDGIRANTIGSARNGDPLPVAVPYPSGAYAPVDIINAYRFNQLPTNANGQGQTIALIEGGDSKTILTDFVAFCQRYNLPYDTNNLSNTLSIHYANTNAAFLSDPTNDWTGEMQLDAEWAHALAPAAKLVVVVGTLPGLGSYGGTNTNGLDPVQYAVTNLGASVVSMSYGVWGTNGTEPTGTEDAVYQTPGVTFVASSGDSGAGTTANQSITALIQPAASPFVLSVGGTSLYYNSTNKQVSQEVVWNNWSAGVALYGGAGGGGGVSVYNDIPSYQVGWNVTTGRGVPDVSLVADPYTGVNIYVNGGWITEGGTSLSAPCWAGLIACRKSFLVSQGKTEKAFFNSVLYNSARKNYSGFFRDIRWGNNNTLSSNGYTAGVGYDLVTGLGSPYAPSIVAIPYNNNISASNGVTAWGRNDAGQSTVPSSLTNANASSPNGLAGGLLHSLAIATNGTVVAWGTNSSGQCSVPAALTNPIITKTNPAVQVAAGYLHSIALRKDGTLLAWGDNSYGQTSIPTNATNNVAQIAAGAYHNVAIKNDGTVVAWGNNNFGQTVVPVGLTNANILTNNAVAAGYAHSMVIRQDGTVVAWGGNSYGQTTVPSDLKNTNTTATNPAIGLAAGFGHSVALKANGSVEAWGENNAGQATVPTVLSGNLPFVANAPTNSITLTNNPVIQIVAGAYHTVALRRDGSVSAWGANAYKQINVPSSQTGALQIGAGAYDTLSSH